jgi:hypothetical protein
MRKKQVLRTIASNQTRPSPPRKPEKNLKARTHASCIRIRCCVIVADQPSRQIVSRIEMVQAASSKRSNSSDPTKLSPASRNGRGPTRGTSHGDGPWSHDFIACAKSAPKREHSACAAAFFI